MKTLAAVRKAYGAGDPVTARDRGKRATGEPFAGKPRPAWSRSTTSELARIAIKTAAMQGDREVHAAGRIARGDGLLTILPTMAA